MATVSVSTKGDHYTNASNLNKDSLSGVIFFGRHLPLKSVRGNITRHTYRMLNYVIA